MARRKSSSKRATRQRSSRPNRLSDLQSTPSWFSWWDELSETVQHALCGTVLLAVALTFFSPILFSGQSLIGGDTVNWRAMAESMFEYEAETGERALWATNGFAGMPGYHIHYPDAVPQIDTIAGWLRQIVWPASHFIFLLSGTYLLVFYLTRQKWAGVMSAIAFGLTTYIPVILVAGHNTKFVTLCFTPWFALAFIYALRRANVLSALLFAIALAINLRGDHVQITYYATFLLGVWWIAEGIVAARGRRLVEFARGTAMLAIGSVVGLLMVAQPYLAQAEYREFTIRGAGPGGSEGALEWDYAMNWSQGWLELLTLIVANAFGGGGQTYWGDKPFTAGPHYIGVIIVLLAIVGLVYRRRAAVAGVAAGTLLIVLFSLGEHFPILNRFMFDHFPLFAAFRVPETWLVIAALGLVMLAGWGIRALSDSTDESEAPVSTRTFYGIAGAMAGLLVALLLFQDVFFRFERPNEIQTVASQIAGSNQLQPDDPRVDQAARQYVSEQVAERASLFRSDTVRSLLFLIAASALIVMSRRRKLPSWAMQAGLALLVLVDLWGVDRRYLNDDVLVSARSAQEQIPEYGFDRFLKDEVRASGGSGHFRVLSLEADPMTNARPSFHYESLGGYHGAKLRLFQDYIENLFFDPSTGRIHPAALDMMNTRYVVAGGAYPGMDPVYQDEQTGLVVSENPSALPRGYFVDAVEYVEGAEAAWQRLLSTDFDLHRTALIHDAELQSVEGVTGSSSAALISYSARHIEWDVETSEPRLFVASEVYYPAGWRAFLDGDEVPIHRVNYLLRGVMVPQGSYRLEMRFDPSSDTIGTWISGIATTIAYGGVLVLIGLPWMRRRRDSDLEVPE